MRFAPRAAAIRATYSRSVGNAERREVHAREPAAVRAFGHAPRHAVIGEVGERMAERRELPVEHREDARLGRMEDHVVDAIVAVHDRGLVARRHVRRQPLDQVVHRVDGLGLARRGTGASSGRSGARGSCRACRSRRGPTAAIVDLVQRRDHAIQLVVVRRALLVRESRAASDPTARGLRRSPEEERVPITSGSSQSAYVFGTGTSVFASAVITRYSRSTACAEGSSLPGGLRRSA